MIVVQPTAAAEMILGYAAADSFGNALGNAIVGELRSSDAEKQRRATRQQINTARGGDVGVDANGDSVIFGRPIDGSSIDLNGVDLTAGTSPGSPGTDVAQVTKGINAETGTLDDSSPTLTGSATNRPLGYYLSSAFLIDTANEFSARDQIINGYLEQIRAQDAQEVEQQIVGNVLNGVGIPLLTYSQNADGSIQGVNGFSQTTQIVQSFVGVINGVAGLVTGGVLTVTGAGLVLAPDPTLISKPLGYLTLTTGLVNIANSSVGLVNSSRNLVSAVEGLTADLPDSGFSLIASTLYPGSQTAAGIASAADLGLAFTSGRVPVGTIEKYAGSALAQRAPAGINEVFNANAAIPRNLPGLITPVGEISASFASKSLDLTQFLTIVSVGYSYATPTIQQSSIGQAFTSPLNPLK